MSERARTTIDSGAADFDTAATEDSGTLGTAASADTERMHGGVPGGTAAINATGMADGSAGYGAGYGQDDTSDETRIDFGTLFPAKGDPRRPPEWFSRALLYVAIAIVVFTFCWRSWGDISYLVLDIIISLFLALAVEPLVVKLVEHGWKRGVASMVSLVGLAVIVGALFTLFGNMFIQQMIAMVRGLPAMYDDIRDLVNQYATFQLPEINSLGTEIFNNIQTSWVTDFAGTAMSTVGGLFSFLLNVMTVAMTTYYISAAGPKLRRSFCQWLAPNTQRRFLLVWTVAQGQISSFLFSRSILALINAACTAIFLEVLQVPYWLPLALFCGVVSQFIPTVGTYIGGALPVLFAWGGRGWMYAVAVLVFIIVYQQVENLILSPKISQRTMDINAAVAFLAVLAFGSLFGALGAFLALPVVASIQAIFRVYTKRYELVDSPLMNDPTGKKSKIVEASEAFGEHVLQPIGEHMPRAAKGTTSRVPMNEELRLLQEQLYAIPETHREIDSDDSATVAIPQHVLSANASGAGNAGNTGINALKGVQDTQDADDDDASAASARTASASVSDNPRAGWR
ncbi:AI-2E family transporter [Bifidobacterium sp. DSM 109959]|uniref:AI-2E family transporter n=2 Tax=Bifidobacterium olomucense TaxID=2675324 RepID=A0A7Y0EWG0_9BIFI|nr:AI-2E family transporter [Bifidobacterium sp. DSM 109959]